MQHQSGDCSKSHLSHGSLFAGIGGLCSAFNCDGFENLFANELDKNVAETYKLNYSPANFIEGSVERIKAEILPPVDVLHGGFPCQSFSIAGSRSGFDDPRGELFFQIPRLLREYGSKRPKVLLLENSPNLSVGDGGAWIRKITHELNKCGYWFGTSNAIVLDVMQHTGVPQSRSRLFILALNSDYFDGNFIRQSDFDTVPTMSIADFLYVGQDVGEEYYLPIGNKYEELILQHRVDDPYQLYQLRKFYVRLPPKGVCPTLTANMGTGGHNVPFIIENNRVRKLTEYECLRLQGFDSKFKFPNHLSLANRYKMIGNAVSPRVASLLVNRIRKLITENK